MIFLLRLLAALALAGPLLALAQQPGLKLKPQTFLLPSPLEDASADPVLFLEADTLSGRTDERMDAQGQVKLRSRGRVLSADALTYDSRSDRVEATGSVRLDRRGDVLETERLVFDLREERGTAESPEYFFRDLKARGRADKLWLDSRTRYRAEGATYSTCELPDKQWYLKLRKLRIDRDEEKGTARGATLRVHEVPVLYIPWVEFPLSDARKTGLLSPFWGTSGRSGFEFTQPIYLNLAPNYDATISPRLLAKRGLMLNSEVRYIGQGFGGMFMGQYLENDRERQGDARYGLSFRHNHALTPRLNFSTNLQKVSDDSYFVDLSNRLTVTAQRNLPRDGTLSYSGGWWNALLRTQTFQTLQDPKAPITPPYFRLPQLAFNAQGSNVRGLDLALQTEYVDFAHPTLLTGQRAIAYPSVSYPLQSSFVTVVPKAGLHYTSYNLAGQSVSDATRTLPIVSLDSTVTFERTTRLNGSAYTQTLEPRLYYVYIPFRDQSRLPVFDTGVADFNIAQIFTENQFVGGDRINDANQVTAALSSRFIDPTNGQERLKATVAQRFYLSPQRVTLDSVLPGSLGVGMPRTATTTQNRSDLLLAANGRLSEAWYVDAAVRLDVNDNRPDRQSYTARYNPRPGATLNMGYRFLRGSYEQVDVSGQWPITERWYGVGRYTYSLLDQRAVTTVAGLEYNADCWLGRIVMQEFATFTGVSNRAIYFQIELGGLTRIGSNPLGVLRQNVIGYQRVNTLNQGQYQDDYYPVQ